MVVKMYKAFVAPSLSVTMPMMILDAIITMDAIDKTMPACTSVAPFVVKNIGICWVNVEIIAKHTNDKANK